MNEALRHALRERRPTLGTWLQFGHTAIAEIMATAGYEWVVIDMEHSVIGVDAVQPLIQVIDLAGSVPLVRLPSNDPVLAKRVMDAGAHGIIVPTVNSAEEAARAVAAVRYPPGGTRGVGLGRAHAYGRRFQEYVQRLDACSVVIVMIEHRLGVERVDEIVRVPGVDAVFIGPYDLSASYGVPGRLDHLAVQEAMQAIVASAHRAKVAAGIHIVHPSLPQLTARLTEGYTFIAYGGDMLFLVPAAVEAAKAAVAAMTGTAAGVSQDRGASRV